MIRIAICDDEKYFRLREEELVGEYMEKRGYSYSIATYSSGKEMLALRDEAGYDIIFLDINMEETGSKRPGAYGRCPTRYLSCL